VYHYEEKGRKKRRQFREINVLSLYFFQEVDDDESWMGNKIMITKFCGVSQKEETRKTE
jgi:hypothetical protein